jgi:hypothetical protein
MTLHIDTPSPTRDMWHNATPIPSTKRGTAWGWLFVYLTIAMSTLALIALSYALPALWGAAVALHDVVQCLNCEGL